MNKLINLLQKTAVVVMLEVVIAIALGSAIIYFVGIPSFNSWRSSNQKTNELRQKLNKVTSNINSLQGADKEEIQRLDEAFNQILPSEIQPLKFLTLADKIAGASGVTFSAGQVEVQKKSALGTPSPPASKPAGGAISSNQQTPSLSAGSTASTQGVGRSTSLAQQQSSGKGLVVKLSFLGRFPNLLKLIENFGRGDIAALITEVSFSNAEDKSGNVAMSINFTLPVSSSVVKVDAETANLLTEAEKGTLAVFLDNIIFTSSPANSPLGRTDPFY